MFTMFRKREKGFTLIELLVVIAVIGVLAGVILGSLSNSRKRAKDAALRISIREFEKLMALHFNETGTFTAFQPNAWYPSSSCASAFSGNYAAQARLICNDIVSKASDWYGASNKFYLGNAVSTANRYSIMIALNDGTFLCTGFSGSSNTTPATTTYWVGRGCNDNP